ncbi:thymidine kinase [Bacteroidia bacterium]|nr:thymidine kinase [Bacteroidia bacterium]MDB9883198.1 thymidine kinase [Bacteroidia bacterium]
MFIEPKNSKGWIEVICGSMFSGKTEELIRRVKRAKIAKQDVRIFKPKMETRYDKVKVVSHDDNYVDSFPVDTSDEILRWVDDVQVVGIDEAQFFDEKLPEICNILANNNKRVVIAGLDMDFLAKPFGVMPQLMAMAEYVTKVHAICMQCGSVAQYSYRFSKSGGQVQLGEKDQYEPRCRACYITGMEEQKVDTDK